MSDRDEKGRFVKGNNANPGGRPAGLSLRRELADFLQEGGHKEEFVKKLYERAVTGNDTHAFRLILQYIEGNPDTFIDMAFKGDLTSSPDWVAFRTRLIAAVGNNPGMRKAITDAIGAEE